MASFKGLVLGWMDGVLVLGCIEASKQVRSVLSKAKFRNQLLVGMMDPRWMEMGKRSRRDLSDLVNYIWVFGYNQIYIPLHLVNPIWKPHSFAPFESNRKTMKSASGMRPPDELHGPSPNSKSQQMFSMNLRMFSWLSCSRKFAFFAIVGASIAECSLNVLGISQILQERLPDPETL